MKLTPLDIQQQQFKVRFRGFDVREVDRFLEQTADAFSAVQDTAKRQEEEIRRHDSTRAWRRRGWVTQERRLIQVLDQRRFRTPADMGELLPPALVEPFTTSELATAIARPRRLAQRMAYCLREMGVIETVGKQGNAILYARSVRPD